MNMQEKRKHSRIESTHLLNYLYSDRSGENNLQGMGRTLNVSESGILLETHTPLEVNNSVSLTIGIEENVVTINGRIIYSKKNQNDMYEAGIGFFDVQEEAQVVLKQFIDSFYARSNK
jgi:hypothetical protein